LYYCIVFSIASSVGRAQAAVAVSSEPSELGYEQSTDSSSSSQSRASAVLLAVLLARSAVVLADAMEAAAAAAGITPAELFAR
jgi:hypothetical protein